MRNLLKMRTLKYILIITITTGIILTIWRYAGIVIYNIYFSLGYKETIGDMFGAVGTLFTGLAFAGLIITLIIQRQDIKKQYDLNNLQNFENNFFKLLELHHRIIDSFTIEIKYDSFHEDIEVLAADREVLYNLNAMDYLAKDFKDRFEKVKKIRFHADPSYDTIFVHSYQHYTFKKYGYMLGHYFRNLYHVFKFIDEEKYLGSYKKKYEYCKIIRAQLSAQEINLLAWNGLSQHGAKFKPLIEKYKLLKNMNFAYEMVDLHWLAEKYPHIKPEILKNNPIFFNHQGLNENNASSKSNIT